MRPGLAIENRSNRCARHIVLVCQVNDVYTNGAKLPNFSYLLWCKFSVSILCAVRMTFLLAHVCQIIYLCAKKQVRGIVAASAVAFVEYAQPLWDRPKVEFPRRSVCNILFAAMTEMTVSHWGERCLPVPAFIGIATDTVSPEMSSERFVSIFALEMPMNKAHWLPFYAPSFWRRSLGYGGRLTTAAHAQTAWIWAVKVAVFLRMMTLEIASWLALNTTVLLVGLGSNGRKLTTTALTVTIRDFVRGIIGVHGKLPFLCQAQDAANVAGHFLLGNTGVIIA